MLKSDGRPIPFEADAETVQHVSFHLQCSRQNNRACDLLLKSLIAFHALRQMLSIAKHMHFMQKDIGWRTREKTKRPFPQTSVRHPN